MSRIASKSLRLVCAGVLSVFVISCAGAHRPDLSAASLQSNQTAIVIIGTAFEAGDLLGKSQHTLYTRWVNTQKKNIKRDKDVIYTSSGIIRKEGDRFATLFVLPSVYVVNPGKYYMTAFRTEPRKRKIYQGSAIIGHPLTGARVAPSFTVAAGEVVYVGKLLMRFDNTADRYEVIDEEERLDRRIWSTDRYKALKPAYKKRLLTLEPVPRLN